MLQACVLALDSHHQPTYAKKNPANIIQQSRSFAHYTFYNSFMGKFCIVDVIYAHDRPDWCYFAWFLLALFAV